LKAEEDKVSTLYCKQPCIHILAIIKFVEYYLSVQCGVSSVTNHTLLFCWSISSDS